MKVLYTAWLSPSRRECYWNDYITIDIAHPDHHETFMEYYNEHASPNIFDLFAEDQQDGLWKIVVVVDVVFSKDSHTGECDVDYYHEEPIAKRKCSSFPLLRAIWSEFRFKLNGKNKHEKMVQLS